MELKHRANRNRAYYRHHRNRVINRKRNIAKHIHWHIRYNQVSRLSKAKIHCSCGMCSKKSRLLGYPKSQRAMIEGFRTQINEYIHENM